MLYRTILLSLVTGLSLLSAPATQTMSWEFWTRNNYKNSWLAGAGMAGAGLVYYLWQQATKPETPEECFAKSQTILSGLHAKYDAKVAAFERGYKIVSDDLTVKNEEFASAQKTWRAQIDEEALAHLGSFSGYWYPNHIKGDVQQLSAVKIELSKMRRQASQEENKDLSLIKNIEALLADISLLFLQLSFLHDCVQTNEVYLDFLVSEKTIAKNYAYVINIPTMHAQLKQVIIKNSTEKSHQYIKFIQSLSKDLVSFTQKINWVKDSLQNTKLFRRAQQLQSSLSGIERRIHADKALHSDLRAYQTELLKQMKKKTKALNAAINSAQIEADKVRGLEGRLTIVITTYQALANQRDANGNQQNNPIHYWELDKVRSVSQDIAKIFTEIQKARDVVRSLEKEKDRMSARFDEARVSVPEQLRLQNTIEQTIQETESAVQTIQNAEKSARKAADDLHIWARRNNLFLV